MSISLALLLSLGPQLPTLPGFLNPTGLTRLGDEVVALSQLPGPAPAQLAVFSAANGPQPSVPNVLAPPLVRSRAGRGSSCGAAARTS